MREHVSWRTVFEYALNPEVFLDASNLRALLENSGFEDTVDREWSRNLAFAELSKWTTLQKEQYRKIVAGSPDLGGQLFVQRALLTNMLPFAACLGTWLQGLSAPGRFEDPIQLRLLALHATDVGAGQPEASRYEAYRTILRLNNLHEADEPASQVYTVANILDDMFKLPALILAMSRRSDVFYLELCAINECFRRYRLPPAWAAFSDCGTLQAQWSRIDCSSPLRGVECKDVSAEAGRIADHLRSLSTENSTRMDAATKWTIALLRELDERLLNYCKSLAQPINAMADLVQRRAREGAVYHHAFKLSGRPLSDWMRDAQTDPLPLVRHLGKSALVRPGEPDRSRLITGLIAPDGKMFRIFSDEDLDIIRRWIVALKAPTSFASDVPFAGMDLDVWADVRGGDESIGAVPKNIREAYFVLQGRALPPQTRNFALAYVKEWLSHASEDLKVNRREFPLQWKDGSLREWLLDQHDASACCEFENTAAVPSREEVVQSSLQLAPLTLIDGAWLQGFTDTSFAASRVGSFLYQTYWDELGNGSYEINHPKIYRDVLRDMGIELPPTGSLDFAYDPRLHETSFQLPVFWLCLGKLPRTCMATILGMNLAMEFSGVGDGYRAAHRFLKHYGFSTLFVDLHNTIDNVSTGHSAWAADAIDTYLRRVLQMHSQDLFNEEWHKVRVGFASLNTKPSLPFSGFSRSSARQQPPREFGCTAALFHHAALG